MSPALPMAAALAAPVSFGVASALQHLGATRAARVPDDGRLRLVRQLPYWAGLALDVCGFALTAVALHALPLYAVEATAAASLAVTAVVAARLTGERLTRAVRWAVLVVMVGVAAVCASSPTGDGPPPPAAASWALVAAVPLGVAAAWWLHRRRPPHAGVALGVLAGTGFGGFGTACHILGEGTTASVGHLAGEPAAWAGATWLVLGLVCFACGLRQGTATAVAAASTVAEVLAPALAGVAFLGDTARPGWGAVAVVGLVAAVAGTVALAAATETPTTPPATW